MDKLLVTVFLLAILLLSACVGIEKTSPSSQDSTADTTVNKSNVSAPIAPIIPPKNSTNSSSASPPPSNNSITLSGKDLEQYSLTEQDVPTDFYFKLTGSRGNPTVDSREITSDQGYNIIYQFGSDSNPQIEFILWHFISLQSFDNPSQASSIPLEPSENVTIEQLPAIGLLGEKNTLRVAVLNQTSNSTKTYFVTQFSANGFYEMVYVRGTDADYNILMQLAKRAESKIAVQKSK